MPAVSHARMVDELAQNLARFDPNNMPEELRDQVLGYFDTRDKSRKRSLKLLWERREHIEKCARLGVHRHERSALGLKQSPWSVRYPDDSDIPIEMVQFVSDNASRWKSAFHASCGLGTPATMQGLLGGPNPIVATEHRDWLLVGAVLGAAMNGVDVDFYPDFRAVKCQAYFYSQVFFTEEIAKRSWNHLIDKLEGGAEVYVASSSIYRGENPWVSVPDERMELELEIEWLGRPRHVFRVVPE